MSVKTCQNIDLLSSTVPYYCRPKPPSQLHFWCWASTKKDVIFLQTFTSAWSVPPPQQQYEYAAHQLTIYNPRTPSLSHKKHSIAQNYRSCTILFHKPSLPSTFIMTSLASNMQALSLNSQISRYDFDCSAFDALHAFSPLTSIPEEHQSLQNSTGNRSSISRSHCARNLSSLVDGYSSETSSTSLSSERSQSRANYSGSSYGYFVDSVSRWNDHR